MMEKMIKRGGEIARERQQSRIDAMAEFVAQRLPNAEIEQLASGFTIRDLRILGRMLDDIDLRFLRSATR